MANSRFFVQFQGELFCIYVKNLSSAGFTNSPNTTRAQLPYKDTFKAVKQSSSHLIFLGYDNNNDVFVSWDFYEVKLRLNSKRNVSFNSRLHFQEEVEEGRILSQKFSNDSQIVLFNRSDLILFFENIHRLFTSSRSTLPRYDLCQKTGLRKIQIGNTTSFSKSN